jgi:hypothetical protein
MFISSIKNRITEWANIRGSTKERIPDQVGELLRLIIRIERVHPRSSSHADRNRETSLHLETKVDHDGLDIRIAKRIIVNPGLRRRTGKERTY